MHTRNCSWTHMSPCCLFGQTCVCLCVCVTVSLVLGDSNGWEGRVSNKCPETHPRRPYLSGSAVGTEGAIFSVRDSFILPLHGLLGDLLSFRDLSDVHSFIPLSLFLSLSLFSYLFPFLWGLFCSRVVISWSEVVELVEKRSIQSRLTDA